MDRNYQKELEQLIADLHSEPIPKRLFLHSCCAPCSSYNPNIMPEEEYQKRLSEQKRLVQEAYGQVHLIEGSYEPEVFRQLARGMEDLPEGGERCFKCYELRLRETARIAKEGGYDYFATTLSISPHKNAAKLNEIGERIGAEYGIKHLPSDFKKKDGYKQSIELSKKYGLYRQTYCGCRDFATQNRDDKNFTP